MTGEKYETFLKGVNAGRLVYTPGEDIYNQARAFFLSSAFEKSVYLLLGGACGVVQDYKKNLDEHIAFMNPMLPLFSEKKRSIVASELELLAIADNVLKNPVHYVAAQANIMHKKNRDDFEDIDINAELEKIPAWKKNILLNEFYSENSTFVQSMEDALLIRKKLNSTYHEQCLPFFVWNVNAVVDFSKGKQQFSNAEEYLKKYVIDKNKWFSQMQNSTHKESSKLKNQKQTGYKHLETPVEYPNMSLCQ